ncbi:spore cortex biosynthesis protein YabQ [Dehalobacterium formicoaceticum]|uniref:spore cortex biosynthesis protein YabQ n=1 Tax=Dehalobacterium formicoaceticum TaxID=51515 RepID=UPI000B7D2522|nr:spore cortex biosynthesis protein YabQ [Dehalobacterium formicoaceticum]
MDFFHSQFFFFLGAVGIGFLVGVLWGIYCGIGIKWFPNARSIPIWDVLWWLAITSVVFILLVQLNGGELRVYLFLGLVSGFLFYYKKFSAHFLKFFGDFLFWAEKTVKTVVRILVMPFRIMKKILVWPIWLLLLLFNKIKSGIIQSGKVVYFLLKVIPRKGKIMIKKIIIPRGRKKK